MIQPGIYENISSSEYHSDSALSRSVLREMRFSPAHCKCRMNTPVQDTPAMLLGRAVHSWCLQPELWDQEWAVWDGGDRRGPAWKEFAAANDGMEILKTSEFEPIKAIADAVHSHPMAGPIIAGARKEVSVFWEWAEGYICKCRPDIWDDDTIWDLKTTQDASPEGFYREISKWGMHHQGGWYLTGSSAKRFGIIAVEKTPPYGVGVYLLDDNYLAHGLREMAAWMERYIQCSETGLWPCYEEFVQIVNKPEWME